MELSREDRPHAITRRFTRVEQASCPTGRGARWYLEPAVCGFCSLEHEVLPLRGCCGEPLGLTHRQGLQTLKNFSSPMHAFIWLAQMAPSQPSGDIDTPRIPMQGDGKPGRRGQKL
jgi:hypothetical protein